MDIASIPLDRLYGPAVVADVSDEFGDFGIIRPNDIEARVKVKPGDILIIRTGYHRYYHGGDEPDLVRYFFKRSGADRELAEWLVERQIRWLAVDSSSPDHPMNSNTRDYWPLVYQEAERVMEQSPADRFPLQPGGSSWSVPPWTVRSTSRGWPRATPSLPTTRPTRSTCVPGSGSATGRP